MEKKKNPIMAAIERNKKKGIKPDPSPEHEAQESPVEEKVEHKSGAEVQDEGGKRKKLFGALLALKKK